MEQESGISALMAKHGRSRTVPELVTSILDGELVTEEAADRWLLLLLSPTGEEGSVGPEETSSSRIPSKIESSVMGTDSGIIVDQIENIF